MSNIPASKRKPTQIEYFDKFIDFRVKVITYIDYDFGLLKQKYDDGSINPHYWVLEKLRNSIYEALQDILYCIMQANTIWISNLYEYNERRRYITKAIGDCNYLKQEIQFAVRSKDVKAEKYINLIPEIESLITSLKNWRKSDNSSLKKFTTEKEKEKEEIKTFIKEELHKKEQEDKEG